MCEEMNDVANCKHLVEEKKNICKLAKFLPACRHTDRHLKSTTSQIPKKSQNNILAMPA